MQLLTNSEFNKKPNTSEYLNGGNMVKPQILLTILISISLFSNFASAKSTSESQLNLSIEDTFNKYTNGCESLDPKLTDLNDCEKNIEEVRQHHFNIFAGALGSGIGSLIIGKKLLEANLQKELRQLKSLDSEFSNLISSSEAKHGNAMDVSEHLKRITAEKPDFKQGLQHLEKWVQGLDQSKKEVKQLSVNIKTLSAKLDLLQIRKLKSIELANKYRNLKLAGASASEIESTRILLETQSSLTIKFANEARQFFDKTVKMGVTYSAIDAYNAEKMSLEASRNAKITKVATAEKVATRFGKFLRFLDAASPVLNGFFILESIDSMTDSAIRSTTEISGLLDDYNDPKYLCSTIRGASEETKANYQKNICILLKAKNKDYTGSVPADQNLSSNASKSASKAAK
jgi:hypothetical protein